MIAAASDGGLLAAVLGVGAALFSVLLGSHLSTSARLARLEGEVGRNTKAIEHQDDCLDEVKAALETLPVGELSRAIERLDTFGTTHSRVELGSLRDRLTRIEVLTGHDPPTIR